MNFRTLRDHCLAKSGATEDQPFGEDVLVFRVMGRMFALTNLQRLPLDVNLKCDPEWAAELRDRFPAVQPGYHMNKQHWNTVELDGSLDDEMVRRMIDHSYERVVSGLRKREREALERM